MSGVPGYNQGVVNTSYYPGSSSYPQGGPITQPGPGAFINWMQSMNLGNPMQYTPTSLSPSQSTGYIPAYGPQDWNAAAGGGSGGFTGAAPGMSGNPNPPTGQPIPAPNGMNGAPLTYDGMGPNGYQGPYGAYAQPGAGYPAGRVPGTGVLPYPPRSNAAGGGGGAAGGSGGGAGSPPAGSNEPLRYPNAATHPFDPSRTVMVDDIGHGDFGNGYDSLGHVAGSMGTGVPDRVLKQQFEIMKMMGQVDWPGSFVNWKKNGMPKAGQYTPEQVAELVGGYKNPRDFNYGQQPGVPAPGTPAPGTPPAGGGLPNWAVPGLGNWSPPMGQIPAAPPAQGGGALPTGGNGFIGSGGGGGSTIDLNTWEPQRGFQGAGYTPYGISQEAVSADPQGYARYTQEMKAAEQARPGSTMLSGGRTPNGNPPYNGVSGGDYSLPYFTQPSFGQGMSDADYQKYLAYNSSVALPWADYMKGAYQNNRDYAEDVRRNDRDYGTDVFRDSRNFGEDARRYNQGFGEDQFRDRRNFGEDTRRFDSTFGEGVRQFDATFGEGQRQYNTTFGEDQRQFNETLDWQKIADAMQTFGARQMPNVRQMSFR